MRRTYGKKGGASNGGLAGAALWDELVATPAAAARAPAAASAAAPAAAAQENAPAAGKPKARSKRAPLGRVDSNAAERGGRCKTSVAPPQPQPQPQPQPPQPPCAPALLAQPPAPGPAPGPARAARDCEGDSETGEEWHEARSKSGEASASCSSSSSFKTAALGDESPRASEASKIVLVFCRFSLEDKRALKQAARRLGEQSAGKESVRIASGDELFTHLVVPEDPSRTIKAMRAALAGAWILRQSWVRDSLAAGRWLPEAPYEASDKFPGARRARELRAVHGPSRRFFAGRELFLEGEEGFTTRDVLETLVAAGGGVLAAQASQADIVVVAKDSPRLLLRGGDPRAVDVNWLLDCIALRGEFSFPAQQAIATAGALQAAVRAGEEREGRELEPSATCEEAEMVFATDKLAGLSLFAPPAVAATATATTAASRWLWWQQAPGLLVRAIELAGPEAARRCAEVSSQWLAPARAALNRVAAESVERVCVVAEARLHSGLSLSPLTREASEAEAAEEEEEELAALVELPGARRAVTRRAAASAMLRGSFAQGEFLSAGSFKEVFKVRNSLSGRWEAVSVMSYREIYECSTLSVVARETAVSVQVSELAASGECPFVVQTLRLLQSATPPPRDLWGGEPREGELEAEPALYQYIFMDLCDLGDLESFLKTLPDELCAPEAVRAALFQMAFALHAARERLGLRHLDVKLLNFFVASAPAQPDSASAREERRVLECRGPCVRRSSLRSAASAASVWGEPLRFDRARLRACGPEWQVRLADFGTADRLARGQRVQVGHFTTLENSPPELFVLGDAAGVDGHDAFALGLCLWHLLTGSRPYEELMAEARCPGPLKTALRKAWRSGARRGGRGGREGRGREEGDGSDAEGGDSGGDEEGADAPASFAVLSEVLEDDKAGALLDTVYRFAVLLGVAPFRDAFGQCAVVAALELLEPPRAAPAAAAQDAKPPSRTVSKARAQFAQDRSRWSLETGEDAHFVRARARLESMPGAAQVLQRLLCVDPAERWSDLACVLASSLFADLRAPPL